MSQSPTRSPDDGPDRNPRVVYEAFLQLLRKGASFSGRERNCAYLNAPGSRFANISAVTGLDFPDDGRGLAVVDWDHDGDLDIWLANRTAPRLRLMRNEMNGRGNQHGFVAFKLQGTTSNRDAIGARVDVVASGHNSVVGDEPSERSTRGNFPLVRTLYAGDGYLSQSSKWLHFGLAQKQKIEQVTVHWPGGDAEGFTGIESGQRYVLVQGHGQAMVWKTPTRTVVLEPSVQKKLNVTDTGRVFLSNHLPMPQLQYRVFDGSDERLIRTRNRPLLINFWASWCLPCIAELKAFGESQRKFNTAGVDVLALSVDGLGQQQTTTSDDAQRFLDKIQFPFESGIATTELLDKIELVQEIIFQRYKPMAVPMSILLDRKGRLSAIYRGRVETDVVLTDASNLNAPHRQLRNLAIPYPGRWQARPFAWELIDIGKYFRDIYPEEMVRYFEFGLEKLAERLRGPLSETSRQDHLNKHASTRRLVVADLRRQGKLEEAASQCQHGIAVDPKNTQLTLILAHIRRQQRKMDEAIEAYQNHLQLAPQDAQASYEAGVLLTRQKQFDQALVRFEQAVDVWSDWPQALNALAWVLATHPDDGVRDGPRAVQLASQALQRSGGEDFAIMDTLATAYASAGRFKEAVQSAQRAAELAAQAGAENVATEIRKHLELYKQGRPFRESAAIRSTDTGQ